MFLVGTSLVGYILARCNGDALGIMDLVGSYVSCTVSTVVIQDVPLVTPSVGALVGGTIKFVGAPLVYQLVPYSVVNEEG